MNKVLVAVAVLIPLLLCYQEAAAVVIGFDGIPSDPSNNGEIAGNEFTGQGIIFSTPDLALNLALNPSRINCLGADRVSINDFSGRIDFEFTGNQISNDLQLWGVVNVDGFITARAFNINNVIVATKNIATTSNTIDYTGFSVHRVEVIGNFKCIDDVSFNLINEQPGNGGANDKVIGGKIILIDSTGILLAGVTTSAFWLIPVTLSSAGLIVYKLRKN